MRTFKTTALLGSTVLFILIASDAANAAAIELNAVEFYTYNGFYQVVSALKMVSHIFASDAFSQLVRGMLVFGISIAGLSYSLKGFATGRTGLSHWMTPAVAGMAIYMSLFVPTGKVIVYDTVLNKMEEVPDVPVGICWVAGSLNYIERNFVDIIETASAPGPGRSYTTTAGGAPFDVALAFSNPNALDSYGVMSLDSYIEDCVAFELERTGGLITYQELAHSTNDLSGVLANAALPSNFTVLRDAANPQGTTVTCEASWAALNPLLSSDAFLNPVLAKACEKAGFNTAIAMEKAQCETLSADFFQEALGVATTAKGIATNNVLARELYTVLGQRGTGSAMMTETNRQAVSSGFGAIVAANEWIPLMKACMTAIAICLIPFLAMFIPTPFAGRAAQAIMGFFIWITAWGCVDALIHSFIIEMAMKSFTTLGAANTAGVSTFIAIPNEAVKALSLFGTMRMTGLVLASFITMMLVKFGGQALVATLQGGMAAVKSAGEQAGRLATLEGATSKQNQLAAAAGAAEYYSPNNPVSSWDNVAASGSMQMGHRTASGLGYGSMGSAIASGTQESSWKVSTSEAQVGAVSSYGRSMNISNQDAQKDLAGGMLWRNAGNLRALGGSEGSEQYSFDTTTKGHSDIGAWNKTVNDLSAATGMTKEQARSAMSLISPYGTFATVIGNEGAADNYRGREVARQGMSAGNTDGSLETFKAAANAGLIPSDTPHDAATSMAQTRRQFASPDGTGYADISVGADGRATVGHQSRDGGGWMDTGSSVLDKEGNRLYGGGHVDKEGYGGFAYNQGRGGTSVGTFQAPADFSGKAGVSLKNALTEKGVHSLASEQSWHDLHNTIKSKGMDNRESQQWSERAGVAYNNSLQASVGENSTFADVKSLNEQKSLGAWLQTQITGQTPAFLGFSAYAQAGGRADIKVTGTNGQEFRANVSAQEAESIQKSLTKANEAGYSAVASESKGIQWLVSVGQGDTAKEGTSFLKEASKVSSGDTSVTGDLWSDYQRRQLSNYLSANPDVDQLTAAKTVQQESVDALRGEGTRAGFIADMTRFGTDKVARDFGSPDTATRISSDKAIAETGPAFGKVKADGDGVRSTNHGNPEVGYNTVDRMKHEASDLTHSTGVGSPVKAPVETTNQEGPGGTMTGHETTATPQGGVTDRILKDAPPELKKGFDKVAGEETQTRGRSVNTDFAGESGIVDKLLSPNDVKEPEHEGGKSDVVDPSVLQGP